MKGQELDDGDKQIHADGEKQEEAPREPTPVKNAEEEVKKVEEQPKQEVQPEKPEEKVAEEQPLPEKKTNKS